MDFHRRFDERRGSIPSQGYNCQFGFEPCERRDLLAANFSEFIDANPRRPATVLALISCRSARATWSSPCPMTIRGRKRGGNGQARMAETNQPLVSEVTP